MAGGGGGEASQETGMKVGGGQRGGEVEQEETGS